MIGNKLEPFKFWCQKVLPNVYDDSLSYYEYLCKLNEYLNEVIGQINTLTDNMEDYESDLSAQWTDYKSTLNAEWLETKNYIDNYFNNLNVQTEINNKLDQMASDGTLDALLLPYFNAYKGEINGIIATQNQNIANILLSLNTLTGRVDNLATLTDGSTTGDAELIDGRSPFSGLNNNTYSSIGNAIRGQVQYLTNDTIMLTGLLNNGEYTYTKFEQGSYAGTAKSDTVLDLGRRIRSANLIFVTRGTKVNMVANTHQINLLHTSAIGNSGADVSIERIYPNETKEFIFSEDKIAYFTVQNTDDSTINVADYDCTITFSIVLKNLIDTERKKYDGVVVRNHQWARIAETNIMHWISASNKCGFDKAIDLTVRNRIRVQQTLNNKYRLIIFFANSDNEYLSNYTLITKAETVIIDRAKVPNATYMYVNIDDSDATIDDTAWNLIKNNSLVVSNLEVDNVYSRTGKHIQVYRFGGSGNDWCFVRTPTSYNPNRSTPYQWVICNHGNGWNMNGNVELANWTKRTMYVPTTDPDYTQDPTQYNGTLDTYLWYSNPTIETLLNNDYIVCGCENYGDNLYGNNNCRNATVDFYKHMIENYNVDKRVNMIGASNGAMTSLNASYLLQGNVKSLVLQYPLTCLVNQYEHYTAHQAPIRSAYGLPDSITEEELIKGVATHDPLTTDVVDGKKCDVFPPTKLYYSPSDSVVNYQYNSLALKTMLENSNKVVASKECSGGHGDASHFAPSEYLAWFNAN